MSTTLKVKFSDMRFYLKIMQESSFDVLSSGSLGCIAGVVRLGRAPTFMVRWLKDSAVLCSIPFPVLLYLCFYVCNRVLTFTKAPNTFLPGIVHRNRGIES